MKYLFLIISLLFFQKSYSQNILIQGLAGDSLVLQKYKDQNPNAIEFADFIAEDIAKKQSGQVVTDLIDICLSDLAEAQKCVNKIEIATDELKIGESNIDLFKELIEKSKLHFAKVDKNIFDKILCRINKQNDNKSCGIKELTDKDFKSKFSFVKILVVDNQIINLDKSDNIIIPQAPHHWMLLSNYAQPVFFSGTVDELMNFQPEKKPIVTGSCENYRIQYDDIRVQNNAVIAFEQICSRPMDQTSQVNRQNSSFWKEHKNLMIGIGILAAGAGYLYLKDKDVTLDVPGFSF